MLKTISFGAGLCILLLSACTQDKQKTVVCWGDSLTAPHTNSTIIGKIKKFFLGDSSYPDVLNEELSDEYQVVNCGVSGESTICIMARQGAYPMQLAHDVTIYEDDERKFKQFLGCHDMEMAVSSYNGQPVHPLCQGGYKEGVAAYVNPCVINGKFYEIQSESSIWKFNNKWISQVNYYIEPFKADKTYVISAGSIIKTKAMRELRNKYAYIFFMGQNGGFSSTADLIRQYRAMIKYSGSNRFIVISYHKPNNVTTTIGSMKVMEDSLSAEFGNHYINLRKYLVNRGLKDAGLEPTQEDRDSLLVGAVPPQLLSDGLHFTKKGYKLIGKLVASHFKKMGY